ncbi:MAG: polysaccharide biosynthesis tyrosine autokinase [Candidatus Electrothrix sp.]
MPIPPHHNTTANQQKNDALLKKYLRTLLQRKETRLPVSVINTNTIPGLNKNQQHAEKELRHYLQELLNREDSVLPVIVINPEAQNSRSSDSKQTLRDQLRILLQHKWLILILTILASLLTVIFTLNQRPIYRASTQVLLQINLPTNNRLLKKNPKYNRNSFLPTQLELIKSFNVARRVVDKLHLAGQYKKYFIPPRTGKRHVPDDLFSEDTVLNDSRDKTELPKKEFATASFADRIARQIQRRVRVRKIKETMIVSIAYSHETPFIAQMVTNAFPEAYMEELRAMNTNTNKNSLQWMTVKIKEERNTLEAIEKKIQGFMQEHNIIAVENKLAVYPERLAKFSNDLSQARTKEKEYQAVFRQIEHAGKNYHALESIALLADNNILQELRAQIFFAEQEIRKLKKKYGPKHPALLKADTEYTQLIKNKNKEIERIIAAYKNNYELARTKVKDLTNLTETTKSEMLAINKHFAQYTTLNQEKNRNIQLLDALVANVKKINITAESEEIQIWPLKKAELPNRPVPFNRKNFTYGALSGLVIAILLAFILEEFNNTPKNAKAFEERYDIPVLGSVEELQKNDRPIIDYIFHHPHSLFAESYRMIRSSLFLSRPDHPPKTLLITSMMPQEGKTTTTGNLARILTVNDKTVLIIDCDMRRPRQHILFGIDNINGLSNYLAGNTDDWQALVQKNEDGAVNLLSAGPLPPNPAELLHSKNMGTLLREAQTHFDIILLDSPPIQQLSDSLALGPLVDGTIIVTRAEKTTYDQLDSGIKKMQEVNTEILGVILSRIKRQNSPREYQGYPS